MRKEKAAGSLLVFTSVIFSARCCSLSAVLSRLGVWGFLSPAVISLCLSLSSIDSLSACGWQGFYTGERLSCSCLCLLCPQCLFSPWPVLSSPMEGLSRFSFSFIFFSLLPLLPVLHFISCLYEIFTPLLSHVMKMGVAMGALGGNGALRGATQPGAAGGPCSHHCKSLWPPCKALEREIWRVISSSLTCIKQVQLAVLGM